MFRKKIDKIFPSARETYLKQMLSFHAIPDTPARPLQLLSDVALPLPAAKRYSQHVTTD